MPGSPYVTFVERSGPNAETILRDLRGRLRASSLPARLVHSIDDPELSLLIIDGDASLTPGDRDGARVWRFEEAES